MQSQAVALAEKVSVPFLQQPANILTSLDEMTQPNQEDAILLANLARQENRPAPDPSRDVVCVQGLGFVGFAMAVAVANARDEAGNPCFQVIGVDLPGEEGRAKVETINAGRMPVST